MSIGPVISVADDRGKVGDRRALAPAQRPERRGERHFAMPLVVSECLTVGRDARDAAVGGDMREHISQPVAVLRKITESDGTAQFTVVRRKQQGTTVGTMPAARLSRVIGLMKLVRCHDGELHTGIGQCLRRIVVDRRLRAPEAARVAAKAYTKIVQPPENLALTFTMRRQWQNHVVIRAGNGVAMAKSSN